MADSIANHSPPTTCGAPQPRPVAPHAIMAAVVLASQASEGPCAYGGNSVIGGDIGPVGRFIDAEALKPSLSSSPQMWRESIFSPRSKKKLTLFQATMRSDTDAMAAVLEADPGALNRPNGAGVTALELALERDKSLSAAFLMQHGAEALRSHFGTERAGETGGGGGRRRRCHRTGEAIRMGQLWCA
jgi:hypothetical protein